MDKIKIEELQSDKFIQELREEVEMVSNTGIGSVKDTVYWQKGKSIVVSLKDYPELRDSNSELYREYLRLADIIQAQTFYLEDIEGVLAYLRENLMYSLKSDVDVAESIRVAMFTQISAMADREKFAKRVKGVIEDSREEFGADYVEIGPMKAQVRPYLKNWIQDYKDILGGQPHFNMDISNYLFKSTNAQRLSQEDKDILKKVLVLYERTKRDPIDPDTLVSYDLDFYGIDAYGGDGLKTRFRPMDEDEIPEEELAEVTEEAEVTEAPKGLEVAEGTEDKIGESKVSQKPVDLRDRIANMSQGKKKEETQPAAPKPKEVEFTMENIDSIKKLNADVMRKVSTDPGVAINKIKSEIIRLTAANPQDMSKAKELWQQSGLYKLYIEMSKQGMDANMPIDKVIESRKTAGKEVLSEVEFGEVVELSKTF